MISIPADCQCGSIGRTDGVRLCVPCHRYWRNDKELVSVSKIIRTVWPIKKVFDGADREVLEHAKQRGIFIDRYFCSYLQHGETRIQFEDFMEYSRQYKPCSTPRLKYVELSIEEYADTLRQEVVIGVQALVKWWANRYHAQTQVICADDDVAGTADLICFDGVFDIKVVSQIDPSYEIQIGAYADLFDDGITTGGLIHVKIDARNRKADVRLVPVDIPSAVRDWRHLREVYFMAQRRSRG